VIAHVLACLVEALAAADGGANTLLVDVAQHPKPDAGRSDADIESEFFQALVDIVPFTRRYS